MDADANANSLDEWGQTVLHLAATQGSSENVGMLLAKHKALLKEIDLDNRTPLHNAAEYGHVDACRKMLEFRCDISVRDRYGDPETKPLHVNLKPEPWTLETQKLLKVCPIRYTVLLLLRSRGL